jgi:hypothetical protein
MPSAGSAAAVIPRAAASECRPARYGLSGHRGASGNGGAPVIVHVGAALATTLIPGTITATAAGR